MSLRPMMRNDRASAMLGMVVEHDAPGESRVSMTVRDDMLNGFAITHGGLVFTLADTAFAIACNEDERVTVAGGADITFLKSTTAGQTLTATAVRRARSGRTGLYDIRVTDETGDLVAEVRGRSITTDRRPPGTSETPANPARATSAIRATSAQPAVPAAEDAQMTEDVRAAGCDDATSAVRATSTIRATSARLAVPAAEDAQITETARSADRRPPCDPDHQRSAALPTTEVSR
ncbi:hydroxyphenylacetyl-CoA thioesterase PaaI [Microbacterium hydrothermale]|uniref:hydroxyphenylacetyl-CoA thioesterase PaaI n=1 Tax=Microbacterium hydrothermale TaxID=857427 RepID=UPI0010A93F01